MATRPRWALTAGAVVAVVATIAGTTAATHHDDPQLQLPFLLVSLLLGTALAQAGALLLGVRPGNRLGPLLFAAGGSMVAEYSLRTYGYVGLVDDPGSLPVADIAAWLGLSLDAFFFPIPLALVLMLFPDGRLSSRRWRPVAVVAVGLVAVNAGLLALRPGPLRDETFRYDVPWRGVLPPGSRDPVAAVLDAVNASGVLLLVSAVVGLLVRYAYANPDDRQRLKPLALAASAAVAFLMVQMVPGLHSLGVVGLVSSVSVGFPAAFAVGALRYRLWDLDRVLVGTLVYGALTVVVTGLYVGVVVALGALAGNRTDAPALLPTLVATALVAVVVTPLKDRLGHAARRLVYGVRATPYEALAALPRQLADVPVVDEVLPQAAEALTLGLGLPSARVRALVDRSSRPSGSDSRARSGSGAWPGSGHAPDLDADVHAHVHAGLDAEAEADVEAKTETVRVAWSPAPPEGPTPDLVSVVVRHLGVVVGDVAVQPWPDRPLSAADRRLLADLAAQAGPALRGVALTSELQDRLEQITRQSAELRASRARIATAQVEERRRLERDIHDGAQQQLVAMAVSLQAAEELLGSADADAGTDANANADTNADAALEAVKRCRAEVVTCIDDLRELARGIYPPVLTARGLAAALRARARKATSEVRVTSSAAVDGRRFGVAVEMAVYFACLEAIQNAMKHAPEAVVHVTFTIDGGDDDGGDDDRDGGDGGDTHDLCFTVSDDGPGFDTAGVADTGGTGLVGIADRVGAVGGEVTVWSEPGRGTRIVGRVPAAAASAPTEGTGTDRAPADGAHTAAEHVAAPTGKQVSTALPS